MSSRKRNFWVGLTVLAAAGVFGWMVLQFGAKTAGVFAVPESEIIITTANVEGLSEGSPLMFRGISVGRIVNMQRDPAGKFVTINAMLDTKPPVPINVDAEIDKSNLLSGTATVNLSLKKDENGKEEDPILPAAGEHYPPLTATYGGLKLIPAEYGDVIGKISRAADAFSAVGEQFQKANIVGHFNDTVVNFNAQVTRIGEMLNSIQDVIGDPGTKQDLKQTLANVKLASDNLRKFSEVDLPKLSQQTSGVLTDADSTIQKAQDRVDALSKQLGDSAARLSALLDSVHAVSEKINNGQGTAGLLVNDPKLYQASVDSIRELNADMLDLQRLLEQWEQEGLSLKLK